MGDLRSQPLLRSVLGGVLAGLAPGAAGPLAMLPALALLWSLADRPRDAAFWGLFAVLISHRWILGLHPLTWMGLPAWLSLPVAVSLLLVCCVAASLLLLLWSLLARWCRSRDGSWRFGQVLLLAMVWGGAELLLEGSPLFWIGVGGSVLPLDRSLAGLARWLGSGGLATLQLIWGWGLWQLWRRRGRRSTGWLLSLLLAHVLGALSLSPPPALAALRLGAWQPAIPTREKFSPERQRRFNAVLSAALQQAAALKVEALVAPEGTLPSRWQPDDVGGVPLPLISGGFRWVRGQLRSSVALVRPDHAALEPLVDKHRLVPLGEWLPPLPAGFTRGLSAVGGLQPGDASRSVQAWPSPSAIAICYEISDGWALAKATSEGAEWLLTIANLDPYPLLLQRQFLALAQLRAIETGRDLLSVANTGPTALVSADGSVQRLMEPGSEAVAAAELQRRRRISGYSRLVSGWTWSSR